MSQETAANTEKMELERKIHNAKGNQHIVIFGTRLNKSPYWEERNKIIDCYFNSTSEVQKDAFLDMFKRNSESLKMILDL